MLNVEGLSKIYRKGSFGKTKFNAVDNATFEIGNGEIISLIGESGSGKTTIGKMILKLSSISSGKIEFDGKDVSLLKGSEVKEYYRHVQGVFQDPFSSFNPIFKADRVFKMVKEEFFKDISASEWNGKLNSSLKKVGLNPNEVFGKFPHQLSGGQLQRLLIARALMLDVKLLVADEIISMLDASTRIDVLNLLAKLRENGLSVLFVTHDLSLGYYISDKSIILYKGVIVEMGKTEKVFQNPVHPYTRSLLEAVPRLDSKWDEIDYKYSHETREDIYIPGTTCGGFLLKEIENGHFAAVKK